MKIKYIIESIKRYLLNNNSLACSYAGYNLLGANEVKSPKGNVLCFWQPSMGNPSCLHKNEGDISKGKERERRRWEMESQRRERLSTNTCNVGDINWVKSIICSMYQKLGYNEELCRMLDYSIGCIHEIRAKREYWYAMHDKYYGISLEDQLLIQTEIQDLGQKEKECLCALKEQIDRIHGNDIKISQRWLNKLKESMYICLEYYPIYEMCLSQLRNGQNSGYDNNETSICGSTSKRW